MKIGEALPELVTKNVPSLSYNDSMLTAVTTLISQDLGIMSIGPEKTRARADPTLRHLAISGYSVISKLSDLAPQSYSGFLSSPCVSNALPIGEVTPDDDLISLLHVFEASTFGFALIEDRVSREPGGIVSVADMLGLYQRGILSSDLSVRDVASSPLFSLPKESSIGNAIHEMMARKVRRIVISGTHYFVSDREVLKFIFFQDHSAMITRAPQKLLDASINEVRTYRAATMRGSEDMKRAAKILHDGQECAISEDGILTPWDLLMKPWRLGRLRIG